LAVGAVMTGVGDDEVKRAVAAWVAQVVQGAFAEGGASGPGATAWAAACWIIAAAPLDTGLGKILDAGDALGGVGDIVARSEHGLTLHTQVPPYLYLTQQRARFGSLVMLQCPYRRCERRLHPGPNKPDCRKPGNEKGLQQATSLGKVEPRGVGGAKEMPA
jgi:hypothetical protein